MKTIKLFCALFLFLALFSCSKQEDAASLPSGENTAYYYLNGNLVIPKGAGFVPPVVKPITANTCILPNNGIVLHFNNSLERFTIYIKPGIVNIGSELLNLGGNNSACNYSNSFAFLSIKGAAGNSNLEFTTAQNSGEVIITKFSANKRKFSGTFKATLYGVNGEQKEITGGVFDINLDTL